MRLVTVLIHMYYLFPNSARRYTRGQPIYAESRETGKFGAVISSIAAAEVGSLIFNFLFVIENKSTFTQLCTAHPLDVFEFTPYLGVEPFDKVKVKN